MEKNNWEWQAKFDEQFEDKFVDEKSYEACIEFVIHESSLQHQRLTNPLPTK